ncbi:FMN reductase [Motilibacter peucedani]|uniref:FMN reductase n=1 Tax=Motilibacter peucedani TaxID=598650 RepID=A0A420XKV6_9ACTN|nr:FMN reductase [Motilibacter peucedani]RKS69176.1 FMN reductase [Motilibacter peucedani]
MRTLAVVTAGLSEPSSTRLLADRLATATRESLQQQGQQVDVRVVELRELAHALTDALLTGFATEELQEAMDAVVRADGVIAVTPIFSASYSGLFKTFFDVLDRDALDGTPVLLGATAGTARHSLALEHALRPLFSYLHAVVVPTAVFAATEDWGADSGLPTRIARASGELADLVAARRREAPADPYRDAVPFEQLLSGLGQG